jgi:hypothetical protein
VSDFISSTTLYVATLSPPRGIELVLETSKVLMTLFNRTGPKSIGFCKDGKLPACMVVADLFGDRMGLHSAHPTLIRELCASFYGPPDGGFDNSSFLRSSIDQLAKQSDASGSSLLLVLAAPWGSAVGDRFWRLCTVRVVDDGSTQYYIDSEYALCSMQVPPARRASSVLGEGGELAASDAAVKAMLGSWRAIDADGAADAGEVVKPVHSTTDGRVAVMAEVIKKLKERDTEREKYVEQLISNQKAETHALVEQALEAERVVWRVDIGALNLALDVSSSEVAIERVRGDALRAEVAAFDDEVSPAVENYIAKFRDGISELRGKQLVLDEELKRTSTRLSEARKKENEARRDKSAFEASLEAKNAEIAALRAELEAGKARSDDSKKTASEQVTKLLDANVDAQKRFNALKAENAALKAELDGSRKAEQQAVVQETKATKARADLERESAALCVELRSARLCARWLLRVKLGKAKAAETPTAVDLCDVACGPDDSDCGQTEVEPPSSSPTTEPIRDEELFNLVASAKGLERHLSSFVEKIQSAGDGSPKPTGNGHGNAYQQPYHPPQPHVQQYTMAPPPVHYQNEGQFYNFYPDQQQQYYAPQPHSPQHFYGPPPQAQFSRPGGRGRR